MQERIAAAAIRQNGVVFTGTRHHLIIADMITAGFVERGSGEQGFVTSYNRFVQRREAREIAAKAGQIKFPLPHKPEMLFSEELWEANGHLIIAPSQE